MYENVKAITYYSVNTLVIFTVQMYDMYVEGKFLF